MELKEDDLKKITGDLINWIKNTMEKSGGKKAIIGISGGKDSSVVAGLCVKALGKENVIGVLMPDGIQDDISYAEDLCELLEIKCARANIEKLTCAFSDIFKEVDNIMPIISKETSLNLPARLRMTLLYAVSQSIEGARVINTGNLSEDWIGYATVYGDTSGAFAPLGMLTSHEVVQIGEYIGITKDLIFKKPSDGLTGKTDEDVFGFSYEVLNKYIREGVCKDLKIKEKIDRMHKYSRYKYLPMPMFSPSLEIKAHDIAKVYKKTDK